MPLQETWASFVETTSCADGHVKLEPLFRNIETLSTVARSVRDAMNMADMTAVKGAICDFLMACVSDASSSDCFQSDSLLDDVELKLFAAAMPDEDADRANLLNAADYLKAFYEAGESGFMCKLRNCGCNGKLCKTPQNCKLLNLSSF